MAPGNDIAVETTAQPPANWDDSIRQGTCAQLTLYHTVAWARRMRGLLGFEPIFVTTSEGGEPALRLLAFSRWPPGIRGLKNSARYLASALRHARLGSLIWHGEPVVVGDAGERHYQSMSEGLGLEARRRWLHVAAGSWPTKYETVLPESWRTRRWGTIQIDLRPPLEELLAATKSSARKAVRRAEKDQISVRRVMNLDDLRRYYIFAADCAQRYDKHMHGFEDFESMWVDLRPDGWFETFVAEHDGDMIAGLSIWGHGDSIGELGSFQSERSFSEKLFGPDLIKWTAIRWGHEQGLRMLDLSGVNPAPEGKEIGIRQFKEKWGGTYHEYTTIS